MRRAALLAMLLAPQLPAAALAQVTPEHAAALQAQLRDWLQTAVGPGLAIGQSPVDVTAAGDHFDLTYPLLTAVGRPLVTAKMTDAGNGRWSIDDVVVPSPSVFNYRLPPSKTGAPSSEVTTTLTIGKLQQQILLDPSFATPTTATSSYGDLSITTQLPGMTQLSHLDSAESHTTITPASDGRVDISGDTSAQGYTMKLPDPSDPQAAAIAVNIAGVSVITTLKDVSKEQGAQMLHLLVQFGQRADKTAGTKSPALDPATSLALLSALGDFAKSVVIAEKLDDMTVTAKGLTGTIKQLGLGLETKIVDGKAEARLPALGGWIDAARSGPRHDGAADPHSCFANPERVACADRRAHATLESRGAEADPGRSGHGRPVQPRADRRCPRRHPDRSGRQQARRSHRDGCSAG